MLTVFKIIILGVVQGAAELLPVSSSAHVVVAEKLMGVDPSTPAAMFVLAMLHTGTMFAVLVYFWNAWRRSYFCSGERFAAVAGRAIVATILTGAIGYPIIKLIEKTVLHGRDVEDLARNLPLVAGCLLAAGLLILFSGRRASAAGLAEAGSGPRDPGDGTPAAHPPAVVTQKEAAWMGLIQAVCLPFRGFSRSGATISVGLLAGAGRRPAEEFSFALAIILTPAVIGREFLRLIRRHPEALHASGAMAHLLAPGLIGLAASFIAGLLALRWLSRWLEEGRWSYFGVYCLIAAGVVGVLAATGF